MDHKVLIIGHGRHGKDTVAEMFETRGYTFKSSSEAAAKIFLYDKLKDEFGYQSFEECYEDRHNHRERWYNEICAYNKDDKARLARDIMSEHDIYVGMRDRDEINLCVEQGIFDNVIWVERPDVPKEDPSSFNIDKVQADTVIINDGNLEALRVKVNAFIMTSRAHRLHKQAYEKPRWQE